MQKPTQEWFYTNYDGSDLDRVLSSKHIHQHLCCLCEMALELKYVDVDSNEFEQNTCFWAKKIMNEQCDCRDYTIKLTTKNDKQIIYECKHKKTNETKKLVINNDGTRSWISECPYYRKFTEFTLSQYYTSKTWKKVRNERFKIDGYQCACCGSAKNLMCCHVNDDSYFEETTNDLKTKCLYCAKKGGGEIERI